MFLRNYFIGFLKESGFVRFAHSILFNFQVPHLRYRRPVCVAVSLTAYLFYHIFFHLSRGFLKFLLEDFQERSALSIFRKSSKVPWLLEIYGLLLSPEEFVSRGDFAIVAQLGKNVNKKIGICLFAWFPVKLTYFFILFDLSFFFIYCSLKIFSGCPFIYMEGFLIFVGPFYQFIEDPSSPTEFGHIFSTKQLNPTNFGKVR